MFTQTPQSVIDVDPEDGFRGFGKPEEAFDLDSASNSNKRHTVDLKMRDLPLEPNETTPSSSFFSRKNSHKVTPKRSKLLKEEHKLTGADNPKNELNLEPKKGIVNRLFKST